MTIEHTFTIEFNDPRYSVLTDALEAYRIVCERRREAGDEWAEVEMDRLDSLLASMIPEVPVSTRHAPPLSQEAQSAIARIQARRTDAADIIARTTHGKADGEAGDKRRR